MIDVLRLEAAAGFPHLAGVRLTGTVRLSASALNDWLRLVRQFPPGLTLEVHEQNRIVMRYGLVHATAIVDDEVRVSGGAPRVRVVLASALVALGLRQVLRHPAVAVEGREITVDLGVLDHGGRYRRYWALLQHVRLQTMSGQVHIAFDAAVE